MAHLGELPPPHGVYGLCLTGHTATGADPCLVRPRSRRAARRAHDAQRGAPQARPAHARVRARRRCSMAQPGLAYNPERALRDAARRARAAGGGVAVPRRAAPSPLAAAGAGAGVAFVATRTTGSSTIGRSSTENAETHALDVAERQGCAAREAVRRRGSNPRPRRRADLALEVAAGRDHGERRAAGCSSGPRSVKNSRGRAEQPATRSEQLVVRRRMAPPAEPLPAGEGDALRVLAHAHEPLLPWSTTRG